MNSFEACGTAAAAALVVRLEATFPPALCLSGGGPDLLLAIAVFAATRRGGTVLPAAALGVLRDLVAGGPPGQFTVAYLLAGWLILAACGRLSQRGLGLTMALTLVAALAVHGGVALAGLASGVGGGGMPLARTAGVALLTALLSPACVLPLAALERLVGSPAKVDLSQKVPA